MFVPKQHAEAQRDSSMSLKEGQTLVCLGLANQIYGESMYDSDDYWMWLKIKALTRARILQLTV